MSLEMRGLLAAALVAFVVLGATFGVAALMRTAQPIVSQSSRRAANPQMALVAEGQGDYAQSCARCHGPQGQGGIGPVLRHLNESASDISQTIKKGVPNAMPAFGSQYSDAQVKALVSYVQSLK